jgi:hypothetical protein
LSSLTFGPPRERRRLAMTFSVRPLLRSRQAWLVAVVVGLAWYPLWWASASPRGLLMARLDHARGRYEVQVYGMTGPATFEYAALLRERYGVRLRFVGGCVVPDEVRWYAQGYNAVSRPLLLEKYGKDIFAECAAAAEAAWKAEHPDQEMPP